MEDSGQGGGGGVLDEGQILGVMVIPGTKQTRDSSERDWPREGMTVWASFIEHLMQIKTIWRYLVESLKRDPCEVS